MPIGTVFAETVTYVTFVVKVIMFSTGDYFKDLPFAVWEAKTIL